MNVPGANLLNKALSVIGAQQIDLYAFESSVTNEIGLDVITYAAPVKLRASVQAVPQEAYSDMGLDLSREYIAIWGSAALKKLTRNTSGDQVEFNGNRYEVMTENDWFVVDGWTAVIAVRVPSP